MLPVVTGLLEVLSVQVMRRGEVDPVVRLRHL